MKITFSQLLIAITLSGISYAKTTDAQVILEKKITIDVSNVSLDNAIKALETIKDVKFIYNQALVESRKNISIHAKDEQLKVLLEKLCKLTGLSYEVLNNSILLELPAKTKTSAEVTDNVLNEYIAPVSVSGTVTDEKGEPIAGVNVKLKGTNVAATTDVNGKYKISVESAATTNGTLVFSYIGYNTLEVPVNGRAAINVQLVGSNNSLNEVIVVAYGTTTKKDLTGAVSSVSATDIEKTISSTPQAALQGRMSGVLVTTGGGDANSAPTIRIRGVTTFSGIAPDPLYVVDGVVINDYGATTTFSVPQQKADDIKGTQNIYNLVNPDDIESISVLKDASSAAAYGSRAANGVILITTKKGREGKAKVTFSAQYGISNVPKTLSVLNTQQYVALENTAHLGDPNWWPATTGTYDVFNPSSPSYLGNSPTYNWQKAIEHKNAPYADYNLAVSGGTANSTYFISGSYQDQQSDLKFNEQKRYSFSAKTDFKVNNYFEVGQTLRIAYTDLDDQRNSTGNAADLYNTRRIKPWQPIYDPNGYDGFAEALPNTYGGVSQNFLAIPSTIHQGFGTLKTLGNVFATLTPVKNLHVTGTVGIDYTTLRRLQLSTDSAALFNGNGSSLGNEIQDLNATSFTLTKRLNATYGFKLGKSSFDLYAHSEEEQFTYHSSIADEPGITGVSDPYLFEASGGTNSTGITTKDGYTHIGYLGRLDYKYADKYILDVTVLRQGSSRFAPGYQWGTFPSVAAAWRISSENFMKGSPFDDFKIKGGVGQLGNDDVLAFQYLSLVQNQFAEYSLHGQSTPTGAYLLNFPNSTLSWERLTTYNIGFEGSYKNTLSFSAEYYDRETKDVLQQYSLPASSGLSSNPYKNIGNVSNKGIEVSANYHNKVGELGYNVGFNFTTVDNKVTKLDGNHPYYNPITGTYVVLGDPINSIYGLKSAGVIKTQAQLQAYQAKFAGSQYVSSLQLGDEMYQDLASAPTAAEVAAGRTYHAGGDGKIDSYDGLIKLGKTIPGYYYGINLGTDYKHFDISLLFSGVGDVQKVNPIKEDGTTYGLQNQLTSALNYWSPGNPNSNNPRAIAYGISNANDFQFSDRFVESAAYLRLSNVQLGYTLPQKLFEKNQAFSKVRVFLSGSNLFLITKYTGYDPENDYTPPARIILVGVNLSF